MQNEERFLLLLLNLNETSVPCSEVYKFPFSNIEMMYLQTSMQNGHGHPKETCSDHWHFHGPPPEEHVTGGYAV